MNVKRFSEDHPVQAAFVLLLIAVLLRVVDLFVVRTDEIIGEQVLNKVGGLILVFVYAWRVKGNLRCIGFHATRWVASVVLGLLVMAAGLLAGYLVTWLTLQWTGQAPGLSASASSHPLVPEETATGGWLLVLIMLVGNAVNSSMEEGLFRGVMITHLGSRMSLFKANLIQALLFGAWHLPVTIRGYVDGQMSLGEAAFLSVGYIVTSGLAGFVWGYLYQKTNSLWGPWAAHALNNTTLNFVHITAAEMPSTVAIVAVVNSLVIVALLPLFRKAAVRLNMPQIVTWV